MPFQVLNQYRTPGPITGVNNTATDSMWGDLHALLAQDPLVSEYHVILNQNGQVLDRPPADLAALLKNSGGQKTIWIDYGGWPMNQAPAWWSFGRPVWSWENFTDFVRAADPRLVVQSLPSEPQYPRPRELAFVPPDMTRYPYFRGLSVNVDLAQVPWSDDGVASGGGYWTTTGDVWVEKFQGYDQYTYRCFGIRLGKGWYFWAYGQLDGWGVTPAHYASFIRWVLEQYKTGGSGPIQGPPAPPGSVEPPGSSQPPGPVTPPSTPTTPSAPSTWWASLSTVEKAALVGGGLALVLGAAIIFGGGADRQEG